MLKNVAVILKKGIEMKRILFFVLVLFIILSFHVFADDGELPEITADYACVYNVESGSLLYNKSAETIVYPGSLVKIMTSVLALEYYQNNPTAEFTVTESALESLKGNNVKLKVGEVVSLYDLIAGVTIAGANDCALVLAEAIAGSVDSFVDMMNEKARALGAFNTSYDNPTGFHSPRMYTTLLDLAKICEWAYKNTEFMSLSSTLSYTMKPTNFSDKRVFNNSNLLLDPKHWLRHYKEGTSGMNVGMTQEAGYTLATVYNNDGQTNIVIIVGGKIDGWDYHYFNEASALIDYTSVSYEYKKLVSRDQPIYDMKVLYGKDTDHVLLATATESSALFPNDVDDSDFTSDYVIDFEECIAPVKKGTQMGSYNVYYKGELVSTVPLIAQGSVKRDFFLYLSGILSDFLNKEIVRATLRLVLALAILSGVISYIVHYYNRLRRLRLEREARIKKLNRAKRSI